MKFFKKILLVFLVFFVIFLFFFIYVNHRVVKINIISFNDFHGAIENPSEVGASKFVYAIKQWKDSNSLIVSAGDNYNGEALSNLSRGKIVNEIFKEIGLLVSSVGNHEFDWGLDKLKELEEEYNIPFISANLFFDNGKEIFEPYIIKDVDGIKVAFVGLTTQETKFKTDQNIVGNIVFEDPVKVAKKIVPYLKDQGVDIVILLTHIGSYFDKNDGKIYFENMNLEELTKIDGVNAIITAHYHKMVSGLVNGIPVIQSMSKGKAISKIDFYIFRKSKKLKNFKLHKRILYKEKENGVLKDDENVLKIIEKYKKNFLSFLNDEIGFLDEDLKYKKYNKSPLGSFLCDILRKKTNAEIAVINGGAIKGELNSGVVKYTDIYKILPFDSVAVKFEMYGKDIKKIFLHGTRAVEIGYLQHSGITIDGENLVLDNGEIIKDNKKYTITANDFMASGGDMYDFSNAKELERFGIIREIIIDSFKEKTN